MAIFYTAIVSIFVMMYLFLERKTRPVDGQVSSTLKKTIRLAMQCVALLFVATALLITLPASYAIYVFIGLACMFFVASYQLIKSKTKHLDWRPSDTLKKYIRLVTQCIVLLLVAAVLILGAAQLTNSDTLLVLLLLACAFVALSILTDKKTAMKILKYAFLLALILATPYIFTGALVILAYLGVGFF